MQHTVAYSQGSKPERCIIFTPKIMIHGLAQSQFQKGTIGTFVTNPNALLDFLIPAIQNYDFPTEGDFAGQGKILLPEEAKAFVQPGVAPRSLLTSDTGVVREYRGEESLYLDRTKVDLGQCDDVYAIVYETEAFTRDPQVSEEDKVTAAENSHVLIVTLGNRGPDAPINPKRFMHNVAGGNARWSLLFGTDIQKKAKEFEAQSADEPIDMPLEEGAAWRFCEWAAENAAMREGEVRNLRGSVDPDSPRVSTVEKVIDTHAKAAETAVSSLKYWKDWATVG
jgi:hypothetical protein